MVCTVKIFAWGSWNFELVHIFLINWIVLLGTHGFHCLFSLVMKNSCLRQFFEVIQLFLDNWIAYCYVWWWKRFAGGIWNFKLVQIFLINWNWIILLGTHIFKSVFFRDGKFLLKAVGILRLSNYSCTNGLYVRHTWIALFVFCCDGIFLLEALEFWACPNILD